MRFGVGLGLVAMLLVLPVVAASGQSAVPITRTAQTAHYRLVLDIGHMEKMYSKTQAASMHPTSGEIMASGRMVMPMGDQMAETRHLEVHVFALDTGRVVTDAHITIAMVQDVTDHLTPVPISAMYGVREGRPDWHYGNNVVMAPGAYTILVTVNGERAPFFVNIGG